MGEECEVISDTWKTNAWSSRRTRRMACDCGAVEKLHERSDCGARENYDFSACSEILTTIRASSMWDTSRVCTVILECANKYIDPFTTPALGLYYEICLTRGPVSTLTNVETGTTKLMRYNRNRASFSLYSRNRVRRTPPIEKKHFTHKGTSATRAFQFLFKFYKLLLTREESEKGRKGNCSIFL